MLDSLVRVSRRDDKRHFVRVPHRHDRETDLDKFRSVSRADKEAWPKHCLPSVPFQQFQVLFHSLFKVLCIFPSRYLFAIGLPPIFSFRWNLPPALSCNPKQLDSSRASRRWYIQGMNGLITLSDAKFLVDLSLAYQWLCFCRLQFGVASHSDFQVELFPLHSPLLGESWLVSFPPLSYMLKFRG